MGYIEINNMVKRQDENGNYNLDMDKEATKKYFIDYVNQHTVFFHTLKEKLDYLIENEYYDKKLFDKYRFADVKRVFQRAYKKKFRFASFMSASKFYTNYALKTDKGDKFLERYEDRVSTTALFLANGDVDEALKMVDVLINQEYQPATPTFLNAGRARSGKHISCFLIDTMDSTEGILYSQNASAQLSRQGGGVGINLSNIRASGEPIKGKDGVAGGVVGVAKMLEQTFNYFDQLGQRQGSGVVYLNIFHADIDSLIDTKKVNADENVRLKTLSMGILIPDKFMELAKEGKNYYTFYPHNVEKEYGQKLNEMDMDEMYDKLISNPNIKKKQMNPRQLLVKIAQIQNESGYPYLIFLDNANNTHALKDIGRIKQSNLCVEIFQLMQESELNGWGKENDYGYDVSCILGSLNVVNIMENKSVEQAVRQGIKGLNTVVDQSDISEVPTVEKAIKDFRAIGLGTMNLHSYLAKNKILYGSEESIEFVRALYSMIRFYSIKQSMELAKEKEFAFKDFDKSEYAKGENGNVFGKYIRDSMLPESDKVKSLFDGIHVPTKEDWKELSEQVREHGMMNSYMNAIAPNGSIAYVQNSSASVLPVTEQIEIRKYGDSTTVYPAPHMTNENKMYFESAFDIDMMDMIDVVAEIQEHVDQGISTTLFVDSDKSTKDLVRYYAYAHKKGLKSLYYTRTKLLNNALECESCSV